MEETQGYGQAADEVVATTYDLAGRLKTLEYPSGLTLTPGYDDLGRVTAVNDGTDDRVTDTYRGHLLEKRTYASGVYLTHLDDNGQNLSGFGYDTFGRLKNHRWKDGDGTLLAGWSHDYDRIGNKKYQEDLQSATQSELYGYDTVYRLDDFKRGQLNEAKTDITNPTRTQTWTLDPLGNWDGTDVDSVTETRTHNTVNELTQRTIGQGGAIDLTYDDAGNLVQDGSANGDHQYVWDYRNRLIQAKEKQDGNWNAVGAYKYDPQGRRVRKVVTNKGGLNGTTRFIWGGDSDWQCLEERDGDDDLVARFTYSLGYIDAVAVQERDLNADTDFGDTNEVVYYQANTLFSVYALSDRDGAVVERYRFDAYGGATVLDADGSADADGLSDVRNPYVFTARRLDPETGLMQYRHRYYAPALGRFVTRDPLSYADALNLFGYARGRTTAGRDPSGTSTVVEVGNPRLPHYFTVTGGEGRVSIPMLITGTVWEVRDWRGRVTFREGVARATRISTCTLIWYSPGGGCVGGRCAVLAPQPYEYGYGHANPIRRLDALGLEDTLAPELLAGSWGLAVKKDPSDSKMDECQRYLFQGACDAAQTCLEQMGVRLEFECVRKALLRAGLIGTVGGQDVVLTVVGACAGFLVANPFAGAAVGGAVSGVLTFAEVDYVIKPCKGIGKEWEGIAQHAHDLCEAKGWR